MPLDMPNIRKMAKKEKEKKRKGRDGRDQKRWKKGEWKIEGTGIQYKGGKAGKRSE